MKKGDANVFWILVFAVLALVVLLVLSIIFSKGIKNVETDFAGCSVRGGTCKVPVNDDCPQGELKFDKENICPKKDNQPQICCVKLNG